MLDGSFLNDQTLHVFLGFRQTLFSFACDSEELLYCNKYTESILETSRSHCNSSKRSNNNFSPSTALPGRRGLYPGKHNEAVGSRDCCLEPGSFAPLHERPPKVEFKSFMLSVYTQCRLL